MTANIQTYQDLLDEKERLQLKLKVQRQVLRDDITEIKESLKPVRSAISVAGKLFTRDNSNLLVNASANGLINLLVRNVLLARTGWFMKTIVPFLLKNYSSHVIADKKDGLLRKVFSWLSKKHENGQVKDPQAN